MGLVQENGCAALHILAGDSEEIPLTIAESGGVQLVLKAVQQHGESLSIKEHGYAILANLGWNGKESQEMVDTFDGIEMIMNGMSANPDVPKVQAFGCAAIQS